VLPHFLLSQIELRDDDDDYDHDHVCCCRVVVRRAPRLRNRDQLVRGHTPCARRVVGDFHRSGHAAPARTPRHGPGARVGGPMRRRRASLNKAVAWVLSSALTIMFAHRVAALSPPARSGAWPPPRRAAGSACSSCTTPPASSSLLAASRPPAGCEKEMMVAWGYLLMLSSCTSIDYPIDCVCTN
jgi:hypothetical protein